jgi:hypothetical protein
MSLRRRGYLEEASTPRYSRTKKGAQEQIDSLPEKARELVLARADGEQLATGKKGDDLLVGSDKRAGGAKLVRYLKKVGWLRQSSILDLYYWHLTDDAQKVLRKAGIRIKRTRS